MKQMLCPYCGAKAELRDSGVVYGGRSYGMIYVCSNYPICDAYVGVHKGTESPLGRMANAELRYWKIRAHNAFDQLWKSRRFSRKKSYRIAADIMGKPFNETHIGMFDVQECKDLIAALKFLNTKDQNALF